VNRHKEGIIKMTKAFKQRPNGKLKAKQRAKACSANDNTNPYDKIKERLNRVARSLPRGFLGFVCVSSDIEIEFHASSEIVDMAKDILRDLRKYHSDDKIANDIASLQSHSMHRLDLDNLDNDLLKTISVCVLINTYLITNELATPNSVLFGACP
jgi:hypothetical protein